MHGQVSWPAKAFAQEARETNARTPIRINKGSMCITLCNLAYFFRVVPGFGALAG